MTNILFLGDNDHILLSIQIIDLIQSEESVLDRNSNYMEGIRLCELNREEVRNIGLMYGVKIVGPVTGLLANSGVSEGFIITRVNNKALNSIKQLQDELNKGMGAMIEGMYPDGTHDHYYTESFKVLD